MSYRAGVVVVVYAAAMRVTVLGRVGAWTDGPELALPAGKPLWVLAMLALAGGKPVAVDALVAGLWGEDAPDSAAKTLQVHVSVLRSRLRVGGVGVSLTAAGYQLGVDPANIDLVQFERLAGEGLAALAGGRPDVSSRLLAAAGAMFSDGVLTNVSDAPFAAHEIDRLTLRRSAVLQGRIEADLALGLGVTLLDEVRAVAEANRFDERACGHLMLVLYRCGQPAAALDAYRSLRTTLGEELGLEPGPALVELERQILMHDARLLVAPDTELRRHNLPEEVSSFIGRVTELTLLETELDRRRLVTLTGAGGSGKTRLAIRLAARVLERFPDGVRLAELAPSQDAQLVVSAVIEAVGGRVDDGLEGLTDTIGSRSLLLVMDNCEHVIETAAAMADQMLRRCRNLKVIATSREPMSIEGELVYRVPPLSLSDGSGNGDAHLLFLDRAAAQRPGFKPAPGEEPLVIEICRRLDGLPLAIELAAARLRTLSLHELAQQLVDRFRLLTGSSHRPLARQQTLRGLIDWSYDLLSDGEQLLLDQLSVFASGFTIDAVNALDVQHQSRDSPVAVLTALVDKSLVELDPTASGRYRLLESIREYAAERLAGRSEPMVRSTRLAHADYYLAIAETAAAAIGHGPGQHDSLQRLDVEQDNLRAAIATLSELPDHIASALRIANALRVYWDMRGLFQEGLTTIARLLDLADHRPDEHYVFGLCTAAILAGELGDTSRASGFAEQATRHAAALGRPGLMFEAANASIVSMLASGRAADAFDTLEGFDPADLSPDQGTRLHLARAYVLVGRDDLVRGRAALETALQIAESTGNERSVVRSVFALAGLEIENRDFESARHHLRRAQEGAAQLRDIPTLAYVALYLGVIALAEHDDVSAWTRYRESLLLTGTSQFEVAVCACLGIAIYCGNQDNSDDAAMLHGYVNGALAASGAAQLLGTVEAELRQVSLGQVRSNLGVATFERLTTSGARLTPSEAVELATSLHPAHVDRKPIA